VRIHPAIIAQAAATAATMLPGRFMLGLGSGENLNEHIFADHWPEADIRLSMLEEAIDIIRSLWKGEQQSYYGGHFIVENARLYTLPEKLPPIMLAASGPKAAETAGRLGDGLISTAPDKQVREKFGSAGGKGKPCYAEMAVCWAGEEKTARKTAFECWPNIAVKGELSQVLPAPAHFEQACKMVREDDVAKQVVCGPDPAAYLKDLQEYEQAGFTHIFLHQIGPDQEGFFRFCERELLPRLRDNGARPEAPSSRTAMRS
jgi:G6PDH family F420-dependent oxidoreductase